MTPSIKAGDFSGGLNTRDAGHIIAPNELTRAEGVDINYKTLKTLGGDRRELIDFDKYPGHSNFPGSAGGTPNSDPILGRWRYYYGMGFAHNAWVRTHGEVCEYWVDGSNQWVTIGAADWPDGAVPDAIQWQNSIYIVHGVPGLAHIGKWLRWNDALGIWQSGDIAPPTSAELVNFCPSFGVEYKGFLYVVSQATEPFMMRRSEILLPYIFDSATGGGWVRMGNTAGDPITGLAVHKGKIIVFRRSSVWAYWISYNGVENMVPVDMSSGCISHRSICATHDAVYYAGINGLNCIYGADNFCVSEKIGPDIDADAEYLQYTQVVHHEYSGTLWATYWEGVAETAVGGGTTEETGHTDKTAFVFNTMTWRADVRRPNIIHPRWVKLPYYRITNYGFPPKSSTMRGSDIPQLHFDAQQPDVREWNPTEPYDPAYIDSDHEGPRHYSYRQNVGWDRDQIPARGYHPVARPADNGIGYNWSIRTKRYVSPEPAYLMWFWFIRLEFFIWKTAPLHQGFDAAYGRVQVDGKWLAPENHVVDNPTWFPIDDNTPEDPVIGGFAFEEWGLKPVDYSKGHSIMLEFNAFGTANRGLVSHAVECRWFTIVYDPWSDIPIPEEVH